MVAGSAGNGNSLAIGAPSGVATIQGGYGHGGGLIGEIGETGYEPSYTGFVVYSGNPGKTNAGGTGGVAPACGASGTGGTGGFGVGGSAGLWCVYLTGYTTTDGLGGAGGYYGAGGSGGNESGMWSAMGASGGSSFISGHAGCDAINSSGVHTGQPNHFSGKVFTSTLMIDGGGYKWTTAKGSQVQMPNPSGGLYPLGEGNSGNGYAKITYVSQ
jgi:hypothetical protein